MGDTDDINIQRIRSDHSDNSMQFWTNNAERLHIDSSGNVGIGTDSPTSTLHLTASTPTLYLETAGGGATDAAYLQKFSGDVYLYNKETTGKLFLGTNNGTKVTIDASGNVGINDASPSELFSINTGSTGISKFTTAYSYHQRNAAIEIAPTAPTAGNGSGYIAQAVAGGGIGIYQGGTYYGGGNYKLYNNATSYSAVHLYQGNIRFQAGDGYATGGEPGDNERMRITPAGNVGIGDKDPSYKFQIQGTTSLAVDTEGTLGDAADTTVGTTAGGQSLRLRTSGSGVMKFAVGSNEKMRMD